MERANISVFFPPSEKTLADAQAYIKGEKTLEEILKETLEDARRDSDD